MRQLLVRHGESEANVDKTILLERPDHDIGLSKLGKKQALACGKQIKAYTKNLPSRLFYDTESCRMHTEFHRWRIWHSPYKRAQQTAELIAKGLGNRVLDVREHFLLGEQQFGLFDGIPDEDLPKRFPAEHAFYKKHEKFEGRFWARMPLGESRFDVAQRVHQAFGTFRRDADKHGIENIIIVAHGVVIRAWVMAWCHKTVKWFEREKNPPNCSVREISNGVDNGYLSYDEIPT